MDSFYENHYNRATRAPIPLWEEGKTPLFDAAIDQEEPKLYPYLLKDKPNAGAIIICAGGAYARKSYHEGEPVAETFNRLGLHAFVLDYRVAPYRYPAGLRDAQRAIRTVRNLAKGLASTRKSPSSAFSAGGPLPQTPRLTLILARRRGRSRGALSCRPDPRFFAMASSALSPTRTIIPS